MWFFIEFSYNFQDVDFENVWEVLLQSNVESYYGNIWNIREFWYN